MEIIIDTSVWLKTMSDGKDIILAAEQSSALKLTPILLESVYDELSGFVVGKDKKSMDSKAALRYIEERLKQKTLKRLDKNLECPLKKVDDIILCTAKKNNFAILTQDLDLAKRAKIMEIKVFVYKKSGKIGE